jgi:hypothetical protein
MRPTSGMVGSAPNIMRKTDENPQRGRSENGGGILRAEPQRLFLNDIEQICTHSLRVRSNLTLLRRDEISLAVE